MVTRQYNKRKETCHQKHNKQEVVDFDWDGEENFLTVFDKDQLNENNDNYTMLRAIYREQEDE